MREHRLIKILKRYSDVVQEKERKGRSTLNVRERMALDIINLERRVDVLIEALTVMAKWVLEAEKPVLLERREDGAITERRLVIGGGKCNKETK